MSDKKSGKMSASEARSAAFNDIRSKTYAYCHMTRSHRSSVLRFTQRAMREWLRNNPGSDIRSEDIDDIPSEISDWILEKFVQRPRRENIGETVLRHRRIVIAAKVRLIQAGLKPTVRNIAKETHLSVGTVQSALKDEREKIRAAQFRTGLNYAGRALRLIISLYYIDRPIMLNESGLLEIAEGCFAPEERLAENLEAAAASLGLKCRIYYSTYPKDDA